MFCQETQRMLQKPDPGISATPHEDNLRYFNVVISGPQDSAYESEDYTLLFVSNSLCVNRLVLCLFVHPMGILVFFQISQ
jgi:hypothetical protein